MGDDLISRQAAIDALWKALHDYEDKTEKQFIESDDLDVGDWIVHRGFVQNMSDIDRRTILNLPPAQPKRIKGKWKRTKANRGYNAEWTCSNCGYTVYAEFCNYHYCSSCGADMRKGEEDASNR